MVIETPGSGIAIQPNKMLDPDPYEMNTEPQPCLQVHKDGSGGEAGGQGRHIPANPALGLGLVGRSKAGRLFCQPVPTAGSSLREESSPC